MTRAFLLVPALALAAAVGFAQETPVVSDSQREAARAALEGQAPPPTGAAEVKATEVQGFADFLAGRYAAAAAAFKYIVTLGGSDAAPEAELALMLREDGRPDEAAAHWLKATLLASTDAFLWNQRAWNYLALGRTREAKDSFRKAAATASRSDDKGEALLGLGLSESFDANPKAAVEPLQQAVNTSPYRRGAANAALARLMAKGHRPADAVPYARLSLEADPAQIDTMRDLAELFSQTGEGIGEWQAWKMLLDQDPADKQGLERTAKLEKWLSRPPQDTLPVLRLGRPIFRLEEGVKAEEDFQSPPVRVALFAGNDGRMHHIEHMYVMASASMTLRDLYRKEDRVDVAEADPFTQWEIVFRPDNHVIEVRNAQGRTVFATKQPFQLIPQNHLFTVLIKNVQPADIAEMDLSDREMRGIIEVIPTPYGFFLVNELPLDSYLISTLREPLPNWVDPVERKTDPVNDMNPRMQSRMMPVEAPLEAFQVMAILARTYMTERLRAAPVNPERTQTCDSKACLVYRGITREGERSAEAVRSTRGLVARLPNGKLPEYHSSCGWASATGIQDRLVPSLAVRSPSDLERLLHHEPERDSFHTASPITPPAWDRWTRVISASDVRSRLEKVKEIGALLKVTATGRDATGRVGGLRFVGSRGELEVAGHSAMESIISPGSLRSNMFVITPLYKGRAIDQLVVFGAGYGHGRGVCLAGMVGQVKSGRGFFDILRHYYPGVVLPGYTPPPPPPEPKPVVVAPPHKKPVLVPGQRPPRKRHVPKKLLQP